MSQERPAFDWQNRRLMGPVFGELAPPMNEIVEKRSVVIPQAGIQHLVMRRDQDVDVIDLEQPKLADDAPDVPRVDAPSRPWAVEALRSECDPAGFA
jgi:hypothetical protein